ncbi:MAG: hypothetical protein BWY63_01757 [Chloroflexi bacterium ADurb.Bin360]|nr:MAG: hypothetical protein BWY63_01757 [Chloroflexi bacterium ADurb.Bin360]
MLPVIAVIEHEPTVIGRDRGAVAADALVIPAVLRARTENGRHILLMPGKEVITISQPDGGPTPVQSDIPSADFLWEKRMILVVFATHDGTEAFPGDSVFTARNHGQDAAARVRRFCPVILAPVGSIGHVIRVIQFYHARVFKPSGIRAIGGCQDRFPQPVPANPVFTHSVTNATDPIQALCAIPHVKETIIVDHSRVEDIDTFPIRIVIRQQKWILRVANKFHAKFSPETNLLHAHCNVFADQGSLPHRPVKGRWDFAPS